MSSSPIISNPVVLVSIDGWGYTKKEKGNAILHATTPHMTAFSQSPLYCHIDASGLSVGLPKGVMGNSEVGHLTMGVGRVEFQDLVRINVALEDGSFYTNPRLQAALQKAKTGNGRFHLLGLVSDGGVHSHIDHLEAFLRAAKKAEVPNTFVHFFADGRGQQRIHSH
jgi:2,3-bisphosphoglycerate-independent phosphoglycerate mutase